jgi:polyadenylate-binding protein
MATTTQNPEYSYNAQPVTPASLYVGDLDPHVTEAILFEVFNSIGPVASIRVCRDTITRRSLGYGYVNYLNIADAERALESLNYVTIRNKAVRIMWSNRDPSVRKNGNGNIFIKNLDPSIDHKTLHDTFSAFGHILSCKVAMDGDVSKGYGFVHYENETQARAAIEAVNGMLLNDRQVFVGLHVSKKERDSKMEEKKSLFTNVYVKNVDNSIGQEEFLELFSKFGPVTSCLLSCDENGASKEFGFVNYENHEDAAKCVNEMNGKEIKGKALFVGRAQKKTEREEDLKRQYEKIREEKLSQYQGMLEADVGVNLYVKNLDDSMDEETLRQEFSTFGVITSCRIMVDEKTGASKGFGFVCFSNPDEATKAVTEMNGRIINSKPLYVALAQRKETRRAQLAQQIQQRTMRMQQSIIPGVPAGYPGQPMFYPPPQQRGFFPPGQPQMMGRPAQFPGQMGPRPPYGAPPQGFQPPVQSARPPRPQRQQGGRGPQANAPQQGKMGGRPHLDLAALANFDADQQKRVLGESLFPLVQGIAPQHAGKLTGMLLEMDNAEILHLLEDSDALKARVDEGLKALEEARNASG